MASLVDTSVWIDFTRSRSPQALKRFIAPYILHPSAHIAEPITFEVLRHATDTEARQLSSQFQTFPELATPGDIWARAAALGRDCRRKNISVGSLDLLIAVVALHHGAELVTFDSDFERIAQACAMRVKLLKRPTP